MNNVIKLDTGIKATFLQTNNPRLAENWRIKSRSSVVRFRGPKRGLGGLTRAERQDYSRRYNELCDRYRELHRAIKRTHWYRRAGKPKMLMTSYMDLGHLIYETKHLASANASRLLGEFYRTKVASEELRQEWRDAERRAG